MSEKQREVLWTLLGQGVPRLGKPYARVRCRCGVEREIQKAHYNAAVRGRMWGSYGCESCGVAANTAAQRQRSAENGTDITGRTYTFLRVGERAPGAGMYSCTCRCERVVVVARKNLVSGNTRSCGAPACVEAVRALGEPHRRRST